MGQLTESLPPEHRAMHYRAMASEVQLLAGEAQFEEVRARFLELARLWLSNADRIERSLIQHGTLQTILDYNAPNTQEPARTVMGTRSRS